MPTADEYTDAARRFRSTAEQLAREAGAQVAWRKVDWMGDGPARTVVEESLTVAGRSIVEASADLVELAAECDRRAAVCAAYRRALDRYRQLPFLDQLLTAAPVRPARWADA